MNPVSSSGETVVVDSQPNAGALLPEGELLTMRVGVGVVNWQADGQPVTLQCDVTHPCDLVMQLRGGPTASYTYVSQPLSFRMSDPVAGCGADDRSDQQRRFRPDDRRLDHLDARRLPPA